VPEGPRLREGPEAKKPETKHRACPPMHQVEHVPGTQEILDTLKVSFLIPVLGNLIFVQFLFFYYDFLLLSPWFYVKLALMSYVEKGFCKYVA
jgi:hypothetical protein